MSETSIEGGCYCGAVRYRATAETLHRAMCYCANCRRAAGAQSVAWITVPFDAFNFVSGLPVRFRTDTDAWRTHCGTCGTSLTYQADDRPDHMDITVGSLDRPEAYAPTKAVFAAEKLPWEPWTG